MRVQEAIRTPKRFRPRLGTYSGSIKIHQPAQHHRLGCSSEMERLSVDGDGAAGREEEKKRRACACLRGLAVAAPGRNDGAHGLQPRHSAAVPRVGAVRRALPPALPLGLLPHAEPRRQHGRPGGGARLLVPARLLRRLPGRAARRGRRARRRRARHDHRPGMHVCLLRVLPRRARAFQQAAGWAQEQARVG